MWQYIIKMLCVDSYPLPPASFYGLMALCHRGTKTALQIFNLQKQTKEINEV